MVLDKVILRHDRTSLLHTLEINLRIPLVLTQIKKGDLLGAPFKNLMKPLLNQVDQLSDFGNYSTVVGISTIIPTKVPDFTDIPNVKGYFLTMVIRITSSNLWTSPYNDYQQELFNIISSQHEKMGKNFQEISDWLNENQYKTPRGKVFTQSHAWGIYTKKIRSIKRFSRDNDTQVVSTGIDIINYVVDR